MICKTEDDLKKALKENPVEGLFLLYGSEPFLIEAYAKQITGKFGGDFDSFNLAKLDGKRFDRDLLIDAVETLPLMASEKCVLLDDLETAKLSPEDQDALCEIVQDMPPGVALVVTGKAGFDRKSAFTKKLIKLAGDVGTAAELGSRTPQGMVSFLKSAAKRQGCEMSNEVARYILDTCETDMATLHSEVAKICAYAGSEPLERRHVDAVAIPRTEARVFDLAKAIQGGNNQRAMEILRDLFYLREQPIAILAVLTMSYTDLYRARAARDSGKTPADVIAAFGYKGREFRVNNAWNSRLSINALRKGLSILLDCDLALKSSPVDSAILLEKAVVELFGIRAIS
jgi:DNA polymerase-3 subunit delta